jgi:hypothetical protein
VAPDEISLILGVEDPAAEREVGTQVVHGAGH